MTPVVRYPAGPITPHGAYHLLKGDLPHMVYRSYDDTCVFNLMGPLAIFDRTQPESIRLKKMKGLIPPWKPIEQKGATQDGSTFITALYDKNEMDLVVEAAGRDREHLRRVVDDWIAAWDAKQPGELSFFTPELGRWWSAVRWAKNPVDDIRGGLFTRQTFTWTAVAHDSFWRSYDDVTQLKREYRVSVDYFNYTTASELGTGWTVAYSGAGTGAIHADGSQVVPTLINGRTAVCRRNSFTTATDNQVVELDVGKFAQWYFAPNTYTDLWARMANSGTPGASGVRLRIGHRKTRLSYFVGGVETVLREIYMLVPSLTNERYMFAAGFDGDPRQFKLWRNGSLMMTVKEFGTGSPLGSNNRSTGFGSAADGTVVPATIRAWGADDNITGPVTGFMARTNVGDQPMFDRYTCFGPGTFHIANGPGSTDMIEFGPLLPGQVAQIRTDPRVRGVVDLTSTPPTPQQLNFFQQAIKDFISFATGNNVPPLLQEIESLFGIQPPQGNMYSLLKGRFTNACAIPPKPAGGPASTYYVKATIDGSDADSQIVAAGTPQRRWPY